MELAVDDGHGSLFVYEDEAWMKENLPMVVDAMNHVLQMIAKKNQMRGIFLDVNNYRHEREGLIGELARERRHMFQSAGLFDALPWKVEW